jgi:hypothetical protein
VIEKKGSNAVTPYKALVVKEILWYDVFLWDGKGRTISDLAAAKNL